MTRTDLLSIEIKCSAFNEPNIVLRVQVNSHRHRCKWRHTEVMSSQTCAPTRHDPTGKWTNLPHKWLAMWNWYLKTTAGFAFISPLFASLPSWISPHREPPRPPSRSLPSIEPRLALIGCEVVDDLVEFTSSGGEDGEATPESRISEREF